jgi:predicted TPR repeat methyltransferase
MDCCRGVAVLRPQGLLAFTVETHRGDGVILGEGLRYAHSEAYLRGALVAAGLIS